jgi:NADH dehydrogenase
MKKRVVVIGAGYAGLKATFALNKHSDSVEVTLIDRLPFHYLQTEVYDFIANKSNISHITKDLYAMTSKLNNVNFVKDEVLDVSFEKKIIYTTSAQQIPYDYLIVSAGSKSAFWDKIEGLSNHSKDIKYIKNSLEFRHKFEQEIFERINAEGSMCSKAFNIVVAGAGLSGIEIATEMSFYSKSFFKNNNYTCDNLNIFLINSKDKILAPFGLKVVTLVERRLQKLGINIMNRTKIDKVDNDYIYLSSGIKLMYDFLIFTGGVEGASLATRLNVPINYKNQIIVDEFLRVNEHVFAIGDIAEASNKEGKKLPQTADIAEQSALLAVENIMRNIKQKGLKAIDFKPRGVLIALGGRYAVANFGKITFDGLMAHITKKMVFGYYRFYLFINSKLWKR